MIIIGLGNPGLKYRWTRHNAGFLFLETLAKKYRKRFRRFKDYEQATIKVMEKEIKLIKPLLFMNNSGIVVSRILEREIDMFIVVLDDINLPIGRIRFRAKGSDGGHLGLRSIIQTLKTEDFPRLRIGIANQDLFERNLDVADFVLRPFGRTEKRILKLVIQKAIEGIELFISTGLEKAQNFINGVNVPTLNISVMNK